MPVRISKAPTLRMTVDVGPLKPKEILKTMQVRDKARNRVIIINVSDFGGRHFPRADYSAVSEVEAEEEALKPPTLDRPSLYTSDELSRMTLAKLRELPEHAALSDGDRRAAKTKGQLVDAMIASRSGDQENED